MIFQVDEMRKDEKKKDYEVGYFDYKEFDKLLKKKKKNKKKTI